MHHQPGWIWLWETGLHCLPCMPVTIKVGRESQETPAPNHGRDGSTGNCSTSTHHSPCPGFNNSKVFVHHYRICTGRKSVQLEKEEGRLWEEKAQKMFGQRVSAFRYCHDHGIIHHEAPKTSCKMQRALQSLETLVLLPGVELALCCKGTVGPRATMLQNWF